MVFPCPGSSGASSSSNIHTEGENFTTAVTCSQSKKRRKMFPPRSDVSLAGCPSSLSCNDTSGRSIGDRFRHSRVVKVNTDGTKSDSNTISERLSSIRSLGMGKGPSGVCKRAHGSETIKKGLSSQNFDQFDFDGDITDNSGVNFQTRSEKTCKNPELYENAKSNLTVDSFDEFQFDGDNQDATGNGNGLLRISKELCKKQPWASECAERGSSIDESDPFEFDGDEVEHMKWEKTNFKNEPIQRCQKKITKKGSMDDQFDLAIDRGESNNSSQPINIESQSLSQPLAHEEPAIIEDCLLASVKVFLDLCINHAFA
jgi:hypothetical protein